MARARTTSTAAVQLPLKQPRKGKAAYEPFVPGPNPKLPQFIAEHSTPYDPATDTYDVPAFDRDLIVDKAAKPKAIYDMHTYWSKKHWAAIREYIRHYLPEKEYPRGTGLVLDCFSGSGMMGVAAMMEDRPSVLIDASPAAAFISHCYTHPVDPEELQAAYDRMMTEPYSAELQAKLEAITGQPIKSLLEELDWLYETRCDRCGGKATTEYVVYSQRFQCPNCAEVVALSDCPEVDAPYPGVGRRSSLIDYKRRRVCPHCFARAHEIPHRNFVISTRTKPFGSAPVRVRYHCKERCKPKADERSHRADPQTLKGKFFRSHDLAKISFIEAVQIPHWYPRRQMMDVSDERVPWGLKWRAGTSNFRQIHELYEKRSLWALSAWISRRHDIYPHWALLDIKLSVSSLTCSRMLTEQKRAITKGTYYIPQIGRAIKVTNALDYSSRMTEKVHHEMMKYKNSETIVSCDNSAKICVEKEHVDYIFIDPPYVDKVQYGELNFVWESWLGFEGTWLADEIVVNPFRNKTIGDWDRDMREVLANLFRALKPGRWLSLCYHDTDAGTWARVQDMLLDSGFEIHTVTVLDPLQKSSNQLTAEKVVKGDLVINCRKPKAGSNGGAAAAEAGLVSIRVRDILIETLSHTAGQTRDKLWDTVLKRLLSRGQMAEHRFDDILGEVAFRSEAGRWFLREEFEQLSDNDVKNEERAGEALTRFARLRMTGVPPQFASEIALHAPRLADRAIDEDAVEQHIREHFLKADSDAKKAKLGGRMKGIEFYDCLFFYLTRWLKGRAAGTTPRRNLADFLDEYLVRFKDGDKWLYRVPDDAEAKSLRKARQTGLGRRIRQFVAYLNGEGDFPRERMPDGKTLVAWLKHCAAFGLPDEGVALFEKGGLAADLARLAEEDRYDAEDYYSQCKRRAAKDRGHAVAEEDEVEDDEESEA